ncbi:efflux RND transporter periplasmic adaptor subunit [Paenibacillus flagellatus]|uniref:Uncharacterized protein n=1 Tax=Paenibacillus flagellatus TaxID=2211139 RepID=A0A2V5K6U1_9BACL|nr:efflux RND transporter periplasmic adaptor subunit [Paenibacillus flagellatus]PYI55121.1 hypothetical protein DLM86_11375 [Paenibacillus flagellatus]
METETTGHPGMYGAKDRGGATPARKRIVRNAIFAFGLLMVSLTLFSNTLLHVSLPQVTVEKPAPGMLSHDVSGSGTIAVAETVELNSDTRWTVDRVFVEKGDKVTAGQTIATFRTAETRGTLLDEEARYEQKKLAIEKLQNQFVEAQKSGNELQSRSIQRDIDSAKLDLQIQERKIAQLRGQLERDAELKSPVTGTVTELNASAGLPLPGGRPVARITDEAAGFRFATTVDTAKAKYVAVGDEVDIIMPSLNNARLKGKVSAIDDPEAASGGGQAAVNAGTRKEIEVELKDPRLKGGEPGELSVSKRMPPSRQLLPNAAVREDENGKYVFVLKEKKGPLGNEFYAQRSAVTIGDADDSKSSIESGLGPLDSVIVSTSKSIADGDRVMMAP